MDQRNQQQQHIHSPQQSQPQNTLHQQQQQQQQQQPSQQQQAPSQQPKKRRKPDSPQDDVASPSEPRRLRRSHEACARCRSKKIKASPVGSHRPQISVRLSHSHPKCDSKHPKCTACATAGVACQQEDRHRQTLTLRGHTEFIERQIALCDALLKRRLPGFNLSNLEEICAREGIELDGPPQPPPDFHSNQFHQHPNAPPPPSPYYPPLVPPGYPHPAVPIYGPYPPHIPMPGPPGTYAPHMHPGFPPPPPQHMHPPPQPILHPSPHQVPPPPPPPPPHPSNAEVKGQDPQSLDMSDTPAIAKSFGVHPLIMGESQLAAQNDREDLAVGSNGLNSGRDQYITDACVPRNASAWFSIHISTPNPGAPSQGVSKFIIWLPKDRKMVNRIVDVYFSHLNFHRPVFFRSDFERRLNALYDAENPQHDPGFICSMYFILALGTLSELNHKATIVDNGVKSPTDSPISTKKLLPNEWPEHYEFFERALAVKPHLRVTITSLQGAHIAAMRQGRSLWRLVGSLVRLSIELGLHHDPTSQNNTFTEEEAQLRIRLWGIVMVHDRGTSILLGRPLAIAPSDSNTPHPSRSLTGQHFDYSEHFVLSHPIAEIQADIINSLYAPSNKSVDTMMRHATRIIKSMTEFRRQLPESYRYYFGGTEDWPLEKRQNLVREITEDQGLTLLKLWIMRILLLRALFSLKELDYMHRSRALVDAITTSHNIIIVHNQLIRFPDTAFFVSPIPLHIAAMVILYGHMSHCERLTRQVMIEDVWMALDMLPRFRWRWERKDLNGGHPLISKLAEKVLNVDLHSVGPPKDPVLLSEVEWDTENVALGSPSMASPRQAHLQQPQQQKTPTMTHPAYQPEANMGNAVAYGPRTASQSTTPVKSVGAPVTPGAVGDKLAEIPTGLFFPFYPENPMASIGTSHVPGSSGGGGVNNDNGDYAQLLAAAAAQPNGPHGTYECHPAQDSYMLEEIIPAPGSANGHATAVWMNVVSASQGLSRLR
ncbi:hypothetical protein JVU11DRAFT_4204 [Chiua virens]|nr:hypothetical protein JVU11DRAFT_4204 [Chiua virens]